MQIEPFSDYNFSRSEIALKNANFFSIYKAQKWKNFKFKAYPFIKGMEAVYRQKSGYQK